MMFVNLKDNFSSQENRYISKMSFSFVWNRSVNYIVSLNPSQQHQLGTEKVQKKYEHKNGSYWQLQTCEIVY